MANVSHRGDMSTHPDVSEMRERYDRMLGGRDVALVDGPVFLLGLYCAASPWILHYTASQPALMTHNLIMGIAIGLLALGFTRAPERMYGLSWAMCALGIHDLEDRGRGGPLAVGRENTVGRRHVQR